MRQLTVLGLYVGALALALACLGLGLALLGRSPAETLPPLIRGAFGSRFAMSETALRTVPVLLCALAAWLPAEAGAVNIGGEGQLQLGAIGAAVAAAALAGADPWLATVGLVAAALAFGMAWAAVPGLLRSAFGVSEALVTLFLNYVALFLVQYLVHGTMRDPASLGWPMGPPLPEPLRLRLLGGTRLHVGAVLVPMLVVALLAIVAWTRFGAELRAAGQNALAGRLVGIPVGRYIFASLVAGGACAALAGYFEVAGVQHRLRLETSQGLGYAGFLVAWMCRGRPALLIPLAVLVAGLGAGAENLQIATGLPMATADVVVGLLLLFVLLGQALMGRIERHRATRRAMESVHG